MAIKRGSGTSSRTPNPVNTVGVWTTEMQVKLYSAILINELKLTGPIRHFMMAALIGHLQKMGQKELSSATVWEHLETRFNFDNLEDKLKVDKTECNTFSLPKKEFQSVINEMKRSGKSGSGASSTPKDSSGRKSSSIANNDQQQASSTHKNEEATTKAHSANKRPTRSTPGSTPAKRRK